MVLMVCSISFITKFPLFNKRRMWVFSYSINIKTAPSARTTSISVPMGYSCMRPAAPEGMFNGLGILDRKLDILEVGWREEELAIMVWNGGKEVFGNKGFWTGREKWWYYDSKKRGWGEVMERKGGGGGIKWKLRRGLVGGVRVNSVECMGERCFGRCLCALPHCTEGETRWQWLTERCYE